MPVHNAAATMIAGMRRAPRSRRAVRIASLLLALAAGISAGAQTIDNPVIAGDHPDPTIIRAGSEYWAASTSGGWVPVFPLYHSTDLQHWTQAGAIFSEAPSWARGDFWAPELVNDRGHIRVYYAARKKDGPLCVGVATAPAPSGPFTDRGPLVCQDDGSIDPSFVRDEQGNPFLIWKEDGNSRHQPTPIWAQPLTDDGLHLLGKPTELIRNDVPWEGGVVEAPYIFRRNGYYYLLYAGSGCCGARCNYAVGVARARRLLGPWEKDPANPIVKDNDRWFCPGHGTAVDSISNPGETYFLFHAYPRNGGVVMGRESVLARLDWKDNWPTINGNNGVPSTGVRAFTFADDFKNGLKPDWQWPLGWKPQIDASAKGIALAAAANQNLAVLTRTLPGISFSAEASLTERKSATKSFAGLAVLSGRDRFLSIGVRGGEILLLRNEGDKETILAHQSLPRAEKIELRILAPSTNEVQFFWRIAGKDWQQLGAEQTGGTQASTLLPGWDRGLRLGLVVSGKDSPALFNGYRDSTPATQTLAAKDSPGARQ